MIAHHAGGDGRPDNPFDRDVLATAAAMIARYGHHATWRARSRVARLCRPGDARARLLWTHVVAAIAFLEGLQRSTAARLQ